MAQVTIAHWLQSATQTLSKEFIPSARLDCLLMLEDVLKRDRSLLIAHQNTILNKDQLARLQSLVQRRATNEPMAYIRGFVEFYGHPFIVSPSVLVPRPESEAFITELSRLPGNQHKLADIGTGSGCIAIAAKLTFPEWQIEGFDISSEAIAVAKQNAEILHAQVSFFIAPLLEAVHAPYSVITANLPYVPKAYEVNNPVHFEPELAVYGGEDGMDLYRKFWLQIKEVQPQYVLTEALPEQHSVQIALAKASDYGLVNTNGYVQVFKRLL